jgi:hypothetical protein
VLCIGVAGCVVTAGAADLPTVLGDDSSGEAHRAFDELCEAGCDPEVLIYILKVIRHRLPCFWWDRDETEDEAKRRREDAAILDQAAAIIKERYAFFLPRENMTDQDAQNLEGWDYMSIVQGGVSPLRVLAGIESIAAELRAPDNNTLHVAPLVEVASLPAKPGTTVEFNIDLNNLPPAPDPEEVRLRPNQDPFDMISRAVTCAYVREATKKWHDREVAVLLAQVGNHKSDERNATFDAKVLRQWRETNYDRLAPLASLAANRLLSLQLPSVESLPAK